MADGQTNERPRWHRCHFFEAGDCVAVSSRRRQYRATIVVVPAHGIWVAALGFSDFTKPFVSPVRVTEEKSTGAENEGVIRIEGDSPVETEFSLPELAQEEVSEAGGEMPIGLIRVELQRGSCDFQSGMQMTGIVVVPVELEGLHEA